MADDPPAPRFEVSLPIECMENVVATVTGYSGSERFNLIKLISKAGGNYVGAMSQSITHLVCWKYEGKKYELARKFKTVVVNHQWIEDCIKEGRRVPEYRYTFECGQEVGPLMLNISLITDKVRDPNPKNDPNKEQNRQQSKRKVSDGSSRQENSSSRSYCLYEPRSQGFQGMELEGLHSPQPPILLNQKKRRSASPDPALRRHRRRLVKKNMRKGTLDLIPNSQQESPRREDFHEQYTSGSVSNHSVQNHESILSTVHECDFTGYESGHNRNEALNHVEDFWDANNDVLDFDDQGLHVKGATSYRVGGDVVNGKDIEHTIKLPTSVELSCVICLTNFSATRGVLPCGHRFCFRCIQGWADHTTSSGKISTCPLCKASFICITKVEDAVSSDQKIYSQTIPHDDSRMEIHILPGCERPNFPSNLSGPPVCCQCSCREPEDLLERCQVCQNQSIHTYCLDPPLFPWTCAGCKDLQRLYLHIH